MRARRMHVFVAAVGILLLLAAACSSKKGSNGGVDVTEKDFSISLAQTSAKAGSVTFNVHNDGPSTHEFVVFKTDLAPDKLPTASDGTVDEEGQGVTHIDEIEDVSSGADQSLTVTLAAGNYVVICNLPGHYQQGMHATFSATA